jgi:hypothetical protein
MYAARTLSPSRRQIGLRQATESLIAFEAGLQDGTAQDAEETRRIVAAYNEDDCRATLALRNWLEERRAPVIPVSWRSGGGLRSSVAEIRHGDAYECEHASGCRDAQGCVVPRQTLCR